MQAVTGGVPCRTSRNRSIQTEEAIMKASVIPIVEDPVFSHDNRAIFSDRLNAAFEMDDPQRRGGGGSAKGVSDWDNQLKAFN